MCIPEDYMLLPFEELPQEFQNDAVKKYYDILKNNKSSLAAKRALDIVICIFLLVFLIVPIIILAFCVKLTSRGPVMYKQVRVTTYNRKFAIYKFRTMVVDADKIGSLVTSAGDPRITKIGRFLRKYRLDEIPQIFNVLKGDMIKFKNEDRMLETSTNIDEDYVGIILPKKMHYNLLYIKSFNFKTDLFLMFKTISEVLFH